MLVLLLLKVFIAKHYREIPSMIIWKHHSDSMELASLLRSHLGLPFIPPLHTLFHPAHPSPHPLPSGNHRLVLCIYERISTFCLSGFPFPTTFLPVAPKSLRASPGLSLLFLGGNSSGFLFPVSPLFSRKRENN